MALCHVHQFRKVPRVVDDAAKQTQAGNDWAARGWSHSLVWMTPKLAIIITAFASVPLRTVVWTIALLWMGLACLLNSRRCGRVHCRYTGPYYLLLTIPVLLIGLNLVPSGNYAWFLLGALSVFGGFLITWATEAAWGRYESSRG